MPKTTAKSKLVPALDREVLREGPEICVFLACRNMVNELRALAVEFKGGSASRGTFLSRCNAILARLSASAEATQRFDIVMPVMGVGQFSPFFWSWFNWWDEHVGEMSPREFGKIERLAKNLQAALVDLRPEGDWLRFKRKPQFTLTHVNRDE